MGNICRSPTAHGVMRHKVGSRGLNKRISVDSAGTHGYHVGQKSDPRSCATATAKGIDMEFIRARKISQLDHHAFDYILAMDQENLTLVQDHAPLSIFGFRKPSRIDIRAASRRPVLWRRVRL
jgi:protein-tyrosine phosphatase